MGYDAHQQASVVGAGETEAAERSAGEVGGAGAEPQGAAERRRGQGEGTRGLRDSSEGTSANSGPDDDPIQLRDRGNSRWHGLGAGAGIASATITANDRADSAHKVRTRRCGGNALGAECGAQDERRGVGGAEAAGAVLRDVAEEGGDGAVRPKRAGSIEENRLGTTGSMNESGALSSREREEERHCERRAPEANHNTRARAMIAARI